LLIYIVLFISILFLVASIYSLTHIVNIYNILFALIGFIGSVVGIKNHFEQKRNKINHLDIFTSIALKQEYFTNRVSEINKILELLNANHKIINVYGNKGVGKTEFLKIIADYVNNNINKKLNNFLIKNNIKKQKYKNIKNYRIIYFDLSDKMGIQEIINEIFSKLFSNIIINDNKSYHHFLNELENIYSNQNMIFIFDNFNNEALKIELIKTIQEHQSQRSADLFIIGSINEFISYTENIFYIEIEALEDMQVIKEFALKKGIDLSDEAVDRLYSMSYGLPIYLNLILHNELISTNSRLLKLNINDYLIQILSNLDEETMKVLKYCGFLSALNTTLNISVFIELGFNTSQLKIYLEKLVKNSLLIDLENNNYKVHDIITDFIIEYHLVNSKPISMNLKHYYKKKQQYKEVVIYSLLTNDFSDKELIIKIITKEIDNDNLAYLFTLGELIRKYQYVNSLYTIDKEIYNYLIYSYLYMKMGMGDYLGAEDLVDNLLTGQIKLVHISDISSDIEFEFNYLVADLLHLQNKYTRAINDFGMLLDIAKNNNIFHDKIPKCMWAIAHSGRHQAEDLKAVLNDYNDCLNFSLKYNNIKYLCRAINGKLCINLAFDNLNYNYLEEINKVYQYADKYNFLDKIVLSTMKYNAIFLRKNMNFILSKDYLDRAYKEHNKAGRRLVADLEFEYGEHFRKLKKYKKAYSYYKKAYDFGKANNDRNLYTHSMLGIILVELISDELFFHDNNTEIKKSLVQNIKTSSEANININKVQSKIILEYVKYDINSNNYGFDSYLKQLNLNKEYNIYKNLNKDTLAELDLIML